MEKRIFATVKFDTDNANEKFKAVLEAQEKLMKAIEDYKEAVDCESLQLEVNG